MNYKDELKYFSKAIKEVRNNIGITRYKASLCCDLKSHTMYDYIEEKGNPTLKSLIKLSKGLKVSIEIKNGKVFVLD